MTDTVLSHMPAVEALIWEYLQAQGQASPKTSSREEKTANLAIIAPAGSSRLQRKDGKSQSPTEEVKNVRKNIRTTV